MTIETEQVDNPDSDEEKEKREELEFPEDDSQVNRIREAVEKVKKIVVYHSNFRRVFNEIRRCHLLSLQSTKPELLFIHGDFGTGKSTILEQYCDLFPRYELDKKMIVPVLRVEIPSNARPRDAVSKFLFDLGDPFYNRGSEKYLTFRAISMARKSGIQLICFDEFQHVIDTETQKVLRQTADWIKTFVNEVKIPVILCGMTDSDRIFKANPQLASRFKKKLLLTPFKPNKQFQSFLQRIDESLPFERVANLSDPLLAQKLYFVSKGIPRILLKVLEEAVEIAVQLNQSRITEFDLYEAFQRLDHSDRPGIKNPFLLESFDLLKALELEERSKKSTKDEQGKPGGKKKE